MRDKLYPDYYYHIYNRGNNSEDLFIEEINFYYFLGKYWDYCYPVVDTYAYCLLKNHFHFLVRIREPGELENVLRGKTINRHIKKRLANKSWSPQMVSQQIGHLFNSYTQAFNKKYNRTGSLFERPFERKRVNSDDYFCKLVCYIHLNPQMHGFVEDYRRYPFSSYSRYLAEVNGYLNTEEVISRFGSEDDFTEAHNKDVSLLEELKLE